MKTIIYSNCKKYFGIAVAALVMLAGCSKDSAEPVMSSGDPSAPGQGGQGLGGSMARFTVAGNYLYTVDNSNMKVFDITDAGNPQWMNDIRTGTGIETIFSRGDKTLFIGSQTGMHIYSTENPAEPELLSTYTHVISCDPVVADDRYAYVTLRNGNRTENMGRCNRGANLLQVIDIKDLRRPVEMRSYTMTAPLGLGIDGNTLFVCDDGLKVFDATSPTNLVEKGKFEISATDVIPHNGTLMVIGADGLYQYRYGNGDMTQLSHIPVVRR